MVDAIFDCANQLFGLVFKHRFELLHHFIFSSLLRIRPDIVAYHPDVLVYEVFEHDNELNSEKLVAIFLHDNYARPYKHGGAWMSHFRAQSRNTHPDEKILVPVIVNNNNFNKGTWKIPNSVIPLCLNCSTSGSSKDEPTLLSFTDAITLFHEFGHGLHGMLSNVTYKRLSGTSVLRDFVELVYYFFRIYNRLFFPSNSSLHNCLNIGYLKK
jgi:peptidyl-dipeptidase Dcp